jgi:hypothetical protein
MRLLCRRHGVISRDNDLGANLQPGRGGGLEPGHRGGVRRPGCRRVRLHGEQFPPRAPCLAMPSRRQPRPAPGLSV